MRGMSCVFAIRKQIFKNRVPVCNRDLAIDVDDRRRRKHKRRRI